MEEEFRGSASMPVVEDGHSEKPSESPGSAASVGASGTGMVEGTETVKTTTIEFHVTYPT